MNTSIHPALKGKPQAADEWVSEEKAASGRVQLQMSSHTSPVDLERYISGQISGGDSLTVLAHLEVCEECQLRLTDIAIEARWQGPERRGEPRVPVNFPARLKLLNPVTSVGPPHRVEIIEISRSGFKLSTPRHLIPKTLVQVHFNGKVMLGEVRYCIKADSGYYAGVKQVKDFPSA